MNTNADGLCCKVWPSQNELGSDRMEGHHRLWLRQALQQHPS
jgi:hypothetical protein